MKIVVFLFLYLFTIASTCQAQIRPLRPPNGIVGRPATPNVDCLSWRLAVETDNFRPWRLVPRACEDYVGNYMLGRQYRDDCDFVANSAIDYAMSLNITGDGQDIWVFDIDETSLSNLPYYARSDVGFGALPYNGTSFDEWVNQGTAPAIPGVLRLYRVVLSRGINVVFISGTPESFRSIRVSNLRRVGYRIWENLILRDGNETESSLEYKSRKRAELLNLGYRIVGNIGDQWSDLIGENPGSRTFKVPDPLYYIP